MTFSPPTPLTFSPPSLSNHFPYSPPTLLLLLTPSPHHPNLHLPKSNPYKFKPKPQSFPPTSPDPLLHDPHPFLSPQDSKNLQTLSTFSYTHQFDHGSLTIRSMDPAETDATASLLAESFAESMLVPGQYTSILAFLVRQYLMERRALVPHATMLVGYYRRSEVGEGEEEGEVLVGTAEVSFDARGANASPPTPVPPRDLPYICNMTVCKGLRSLSTENAQDIGYQHEWLSCLLPDIKKDKKLCVLKYLWTF
ncbi:hypothetical protein QJS04_geneDACA013274 [Acorus gramineus]|uniref:Uncharacterized protein n=1 Tax=Acorus gramineus TaxID=55184 RepID=A0AAV9BCM3_ACOGR|nr:hypothetical protein QJS04_geneDACA013274 [Acorus gramineus]